METTDPRRLVRRRDDRIVGGVCGGIADHLGIDATIVRIVTVALMVFGGAGVLLYVVAWALIPLEGDEDRRRPGWNRSWQTIAGLVLIGIAIATVSDRVLPVGHFGFPVFLIALGAFLLWYRSPDDRDDRRPDRAWAPPPWPAPPAPPGPPSTFAASGPPTTTVTMPVTAGETPPAAGWAAGEGDPTVPGPAAADATADATAEMPASADVAGAPPPGTSAREWHREWHRRQALEMRQWRVQQRDWQRRSRRRRRRASLAAPVLGILAIGAGVTGIALGAGFGVDATRVMAVGLIVVAAGLIVATFVGRPGGLVFVGLQLLILLTLVTAVSIPFEGGIGRHTSAPASLAELQPGYHLAIGNLTVDLGAIHPAAGETRQVEATVGIGHLLVLVAPDVEVVAHGQTELGNVQLNGTDDGGWKVDQRRVLHRGSEGTGRIELDARVGIGQVEVRDA